MVLLIIVSSFWLISELGLAYFKRATIHSEDMDQSSLQLIWLTISVSVSIGVYLGMSGRGFLNLYVQSTYYCALGLILLGLLVRWIAIFQLKEHFTVNVSIRDDHRLVEHGIYGYIRHPAYTGLLISFFGLGLAFNNVLSLITIFLPTLFVFLYRIVIEENLLIKSFGNTYEEYRKRTKKLLPMIY